MRSGIVGVDVDKALDHPSEIFTSPEEVLECTEISADNKAAILSRWAYDVREVAVAEEEGMLGPDTALMRRINLALDQLPKPGANNGGTPGKQGNI